MIWRSSYVHLIMSKNIILFGGSFNPPHFGHLIVIQQALELIKDIDELWLLPAYRHTFQKDLAQFPHRIKMAQTLMMQLSLETQENIKVETIECDHRLRGETYQAYALLRKRYLDYNFSFLMGSDQLPNFNKWGNYEQLLQFMHFYVYPRPGFSTKITYPNMSLLKDKNQIITNISSTYVRERIKDDLPINHLVPTAITSYIQAEKVYE